MLYTYKGIAPKLGRADLIWQELQLGQASIPIASQSASDAHAGAPSD